MFEPKKKKDKLYIGYSIGPDGREPEYWHKGVHMKTHGKGLRASRPGSSASSLSSKVGSLPRPN